MSHTQFEKRCDILADLWISYRDVAELKDFVDYNDLGLPLAYCTAESMTTLTAKGEHFVNETFDLLMTSLQMEDTGFDSIDEILGQASE